MEVDAKIYEGVTTYMNLLKVREDLINSKEKVLKCNGEMRKHQEVGAIPNKLKKEADELRYAVIFEDEVLEMKTSEKGPLKMKIDKQFADIKNILINVNTSYKDKMRVVRKAKNMYKMEPGSLRTANMH